MANRDRRNRRRAGRKAKAAPVTLAETSRQETAPDDVEDPLEPGRQIRVLRNVAEHPLTLLHSKHQISQAELAAGEEFRKHYERAIIGGAKAIDYARPQVDGGRLAEPLSEGVQEAHEWLNGVARRGKLGKSGWAVMVAIAGEGGSLRDVARRWENATGMAGDRGEGVVRGLLTGALERLAEHLGITRRHAPIRGTGEMTMTGPQREWEVGRFGEGLVEKPSRFKQPVAKQA